MSSCKSFVFHYCDSKKRTKWTILLEGTTMKLKAIVIWNSSTISSICSEWWQLSKCFSLNVLNKREAKVENVDNLVANSSWSLNCKPRNHICSRKVTKFVSWREVFDRKEVAEAEEEFANEVEKIVPKYKLACVLNADQSGFQYELASNRTYTFSSERSTFVAVKLLNATTVSSYMVIYHCAYLIWACISYFRSFETYYKVKPNFNFL